MSTSYRITLEVIRQLIGSRRTYHIVRRLAEGPIESTSAMATLRAAFADMVSDLGEEAEQLSARFESLLDEVWRAKRELQRKVAG